MPAFCAHDERRSHRRWPVTLSARVRYAGRLHRTTVLDVSGGGLLVELTDTLPAAARDVVQVEAPQIGVIEARVVGVSSHGMHLEIVEASPAYMVAVRRLADLAAAWHAP